MGTTNRTRALLVSSSMILLCMTAVVGMTFTLFTDKTDVSNHLRAGDMNITLVRTELETTSLSDSGFFETKTDSELKDFTNETKDNVFDINNDVIVPGSKYVAEMTITNNKPVGNIGAAKSDVPYGYWIEVVYTGKKNLDLAKQIKIAVNTDNAEYLSNGLVVGGERLPIGVLDVGESDVFTVTVEFLDDERLPENKSFDNDAAQGNSVSFDLVVHAVQYTGTTSKALKKA